MSARGPSGHDYPACVTAERRQFVGEKVDPFVDFGNDLIERRIRRERVTDQRDIDAVPHRTPSKQREDFFGSLLPVAAVDEDQRWSFFGRFEEVDTIALARAISEVEVIGI